MPAARIVLAALVSAGALVAVPAATAALTERPLVYVVSIDGLDGDAVDQGKAPFIASLLAGDDAFATLFQESRSVMPAETNPNHVAMMTGAYGGASGIPANAFALYASLPNEDSCAATGPFDFARAPTPTSGEDATCLLAETTFAAIKRQGDPDALVTAAILGKPKLGRIFANRTVDPERLDVDHLWAPCSSGADDDAYCGDAPTNPATGYAIDDTVVMDEVLRVADEGVLEDGRIKRPDLVFVNLPQVDSAGHATGRGPIYDQAVGMADAEIQRLVTQLRTRLEWERTVLILVSDHSMDTTPTKVSPADRFADAGVADDQYVEVPNGSASLIYLADRTSPQRFELLKKMRDAALTDSGISEVLYREPNPADGGDQHTIDAVHPAWGLAGERTGDLVVLTKPGASFEESVPLPGTHGAPQTRDNFLAVVGGRGFVRGQLLTGAADALFDDTLTNPTQSENVDIASTVMGLFGLFAPRDNAGRFLREAFDRRLLPGFAKPSVAPRLAVRAVKGKRRCRYRLTFTPAGGVYDVQRRQAGRWRPIRWHTTRTAVRVAGPRGLRFRVRSRAASNVHSAWRATPRKCR